MLVWLSFADGTKPRGQQRLGVVVLELQHGQDPLLAVTERGLVPPGANDVQVFECDPSDMPEELWGQFIPAERMDELDLGVRTSMQRTICEDCVRERLGDGDATA